MSMRLYYAPFSPNARRALMTAIHLGVSFERVLVDLRNGEQKRPEYLKLNPNGKVPTLDDDGFVVWESRAIMIYLAEKTPGQTVYPQDLRGRADVNHWLFWDAVHFSPAVGILAYERLIKSWFGMGAPDPKEIERGERLLAPLLNVLDGQLDGRQWVCGSTLTLADLSLATPLVFAEQAGIALPQHIAAWFARVQKLDAWQQALPPPTPSKA
jgi:glutathione S-transferase